MEEGHNTEVASRLECFYTQWSAVPPVGGQRHYRHSIAIHSHSAPFEYADLDSSL